MSSFFDLYFDFVQDNTESPIMYHRWSAISALGAMLEKNFYFTHGHYRINPNLYTMLIGTPGTRKSSAIKLITKLVVEAGYHNIAADKTSKEKFLEDLAAVNNIGAISSSMGSFLDKPLFGSDAVDPASMLVAADEWNDFTGTGNLEFYSLLGTLWDKQDDYHYKTKAGDTVIPDPVVSILSGNTPVGFAAAFPTDIIGQGFFSRLLLIYGEPTGKRIAFPEEPDPLKRLEITKKLQKIRASIRGKAEITAEAKRMLESIYENYKPLPDPRFDSYGNRRFNQLIKLCLIHSAARESKLIEKEDVLLSNTILTFTENYMPKALGEFGKSKNADVSHKVMTALNATDTPLRIPELWEQLNTDLEEIRILADIIRNLVEANKVQRVDFVDSAGAAQKGFLPKKHIRATKGLYVDYSLLTEEERKVQY